MKSKYLLLLVAFLITATSHAQNTFPTTGSAGIGTTTPDASAILEVKSITQGILIPRMPRVRRDAIVSPATGLMIYQTSGITGFYYYDGTVWLPVAPRAWSLAGNSGTDTATNFIGTTDAMPLVFKVNNQNSGFIDYAPGRSNTALGYQSLYSNTTGYNNTAFGYNALYSNIGTTIKSPLPQFGNNNTAIGAFALLGNTGSYNTAAGTFSLNHNTSGSNNAAYGSVSLFANTTGFANAAFGDNSLVANITGSKNTANGADALSNNKSGNNNTATGYEALFYDSSGYSNVAIGSEALLFNRHNSNLVAVGDSALYNNGTGATTLSQASGNTAIGSKSLFTNTTGYYNTATGYQSVNKNTTGYYNTANGYQALYNNTVGYDNTAVGRSAMSANTTGFGNIAVGYSAGSISAKDTFCTFVGWDADQSSSTGYYNSMALGSLARITQSNYIVIGNTAINSIKGQVNFTTFSDGRFKKDIKENVPGLQFINKLKPVTYHLDVPGISRFLKEDSDDSANSKDGKSAQDLMKKAREEKEKILYTGFVAQDVEKAAKELKYDFSGVDKPENDNSLYGLRYAEFVVPLVKAVQELSNMNDTKDAKIDSLQKKSDNLQQQFNELKTLVLSLQQNINSCSPCSGFNNSQAQSSGSVITGGASLDQNAPNPFAGSTSIGYSLPLKFSSAQIIITAQDGKVLKQVALNGSGKGMLNIEASTLSSGAYSYSLIVDGKLMDTKRMVLAK